MTDDGFITPPPGIPRREPVPPAEKPGQADIELPPDLPDSGTYKLSERATRVPAPKPSKPEIVFFPTAPGAPPADAAPTPTAPAAATPPPPAVPPVVPLTPVTPAAADDGATVMSPKRHAAPSWRLVLTGLPPVTVDGTLYLGRDPAVPVGEPGAHAVRLSDPAKSVSKTHARIDLTDGVLRVWDLHSTNGVWVVPPGAEPIQVAPGESVAVPAGADIELGDFVIQVEHG